MITCKLTFNKKYRNSILNKGTVDFNLAVPEPESLQIESSSSNSACIYTYISGMFMIPPKELISTIDTKILRYIDINLSNQDIPFESKLTRLDNYSEFAKVIVSDCEAAYNVGHLLTNNIILYDFPTEYLWRLHNWGCRSNAESCVISYTQEKVSAIFKTWSLPPLKWCDALRSKHIEFEFDYADEGDNI